LVELAAFNKLHAEVTRAIALPDFIDGNDSWMFEASRGFCFPAETPQVPFGGPRAEANQFECHSAIETLLMSAINYALTAAAHFL
jgi:hypothetical protein